MIREIYIKNCALVEEIRLTIDDNLNIITGETGSGKSIIIDSLNLCLGSKFDRTFLRKGETKGIVEIVFEVKNNKLYQVLGEQGIDFEDDNLLIVSRTISAEGKSYARINGRTVKLSTLKTITSMLVDVHVQHQNNALLNVENHIDFLDMYGGNLILNRKNEYLEVYTNYKRILTSLSGLKENKDDIQIQRELDLLKFQVNEIDSAGLDEDEYDELIKKRDIYRNSEKIYNKLSLSFNTIKNDEINIVDLIGTVSKDLCDISEYDKILEEYSKEIERIMYEIQDISSGIREYKDSINFQPHELEEIEIRIDEINNLKRKYGSTIYEILKYRDDISLRIDEIVNRDKIIENKNKELQEVTLKLDRVALNLTKVRKEVAKKLVTNLLFELNSLNMRNISFDVDIYQIDYSAKGRDSVEFKVSFNLGEDLKSINKVASGGELSRFMLAFKTILADIDDIDTMVFDEIDSGISGVAAQIVGKKLSKISYKKQIICITHLPQIAANATNHYYIEKTIKGERTVAEVELLDNNRRVEEIARLISGSNITKKTIESANEILEYAKSIL